MKLKSKVRSLVATTLLFAGASSFAATLNYTVGKGENITFEEMFGGNNGTTTYSAGDAIKVTADGVTTVNISQALADALTAKNVDGIPDNTSAIEVGVVGFQANGNDYFAILQFEATKDGVAATVGFNNNKMAVNGSDIDALGESLIYTVTDILKDDGTTVTDDGVVLTNAYVFNGIGIGSAKSSELPNQTFYINSKADTLPLDTGTPDFTGNAQDWTTTPVKKLRWRCLGSKVNNSFVKIQFDTDGMIPPSGPTELDTLDQFDNVAADGTASLLSAGGTTDAPTYADWAAVQTALGSVLKVNGVELLTCHGRTIQRLLMLEQLELIILVVQLVQC